MGQFDNKSGPQFFGRDGFGRERSQRSEVKSERQMYTVNCSNCGRECQVPFRPTGAKPVYCDECFAKLRGNSRGRNDERPRFGSRNPRSVQRNGNADSQTRQSLQDINSKLDKILSILEPKVERLESPKYEPTSVLSSDDLDKTPSVNVQEITESGVIMDTLPEAEGESVVKESENKKVSKPRKTAKRKASAEKEV